MTWQTIHFSIIKKYYEIRINTTIHFSVSLIMKYYEIRIQSGSFNRGVYSRDLNPEIAILVHRQHGYLCRAIWLLCSIVIGQRPLLL